jgi:hypothetical protein
MATVSLCAVLSCLFSLKICALVASAAACALQNGITSLDTTRDGSRLIASSTDHGYHCVPFLLCSLTAVCDGCSIYMYNMLNPARQCMGIFRGHCTGSFYGESVHDLRFHGGLTLYVLRC